MIRRVVFNRKGGVGKSTLVCNLAAAAALAGRRTLVVDLDPQGNASHYLLGEAAAEAKPDLAAFFEETLSLRIFSTPPESFVHPTPVEGLSLLPSSPELLELQGKLESRYKIYKLRDLLEKLRGFDEVWLDTPPSVGFFTLSALIAADRCLIPFDCDEFSRRALYQLVGTVREVKADHNEHLEIEGVIVNLFQSRARQPRRVVEELAREGLPILEPFVHSTVKIKESHEARSPLVVTAPRHKVARQLVELYESLSSRP